MTVTYLSSLTSALDPVVLYRILKLRVDVFVVEQGCAYPELDGRDIEATAQQFWAENEDGEVLATVRLLHDADDRRIGRVATSEAARGHGYAGVLMQNAVDASDGRAIHLDAQERLEQWYGRFGFVRSGPDFLEDDLVHIPMTRAAA
jgi:ElaA protein